MFPTQKIKLSGRTIRKLPLLCLSEFFSEFPVSFNNFLVALASTIKKHADSQQDSH